MFTKLYIQVKCEMNDEHVIERKNQGYLIFFCSLAIACIYKIAISYLDLSTNHNFKNWDAKTCTPADFTIELKITDSMIDGFERHQ